MAQVLTPQELGKIVDHVFLPPKLPQYKHDPPDSSLLIITLNALDRFRGFASAGSPALAQAYMALDTLRRINSLPGGTVCGKTLGDMMSTIRNGDMLAVKVEAQNAALVVTRQDDKVIFEEFELSARNCDVIDTKGRLTQSFPGLAVAVDWHIIQADDLDFCTSIAHTIAVMSSEPAPSMQAKSKKSGHQHEEERDTAHPGLVSELLVGGILRGIGSPVAVRGVKKQTRDEVLWDNTLLPWRRSGMWLLIRVLLQLTIVRSPNGSRLLYKEFMAFFMGILLESSLKLPPESDMLHVMNAKIARRLHKLGNRFGAANNEVFAGVHAALSTSYGIIQSRWTTIQTLEKEDMGPPSSSTGTSVKDAAVDIPALDEYIKSIREVEVSSVGPNFKPQSQLLRLTSNSLPIMPGLLPRDYHYAVAQLQQVETWVSESLSAWVANHPDPGALHQLSEVLVQYHNHAATHYANNPEGTSTMILTVYELWMACDQIACAACHLLEDYDPEIPESILENLLLPSLISMRRLQVIERYLDRRRRQSSLFAANLFDIHSKRGFPARYFDDSTFHQDLLSEINERADREKTAKETEFDEKKVKHAHLTSMATQMEHEWVEIITDAYGEWQKTEMCHVQSCRKCKVEHQAAALSISVHEWSLPFDQTEAKCVVFELQAPQWFVHWRETRQYLIINVLNGEVPKAQPQTRFCLPSNDPHLSSAYYKGETGRRISLLSEVKPNVVTHYRNKPMASTRKHEVCLRNGLRYEYYDFEDGAFIGPISFSDRMVLACTYHLPVTCQQMQRYIVRPAARPDGVPPNTVLARQNDCPSNTTLEEYKDLATIPLGRHIQWSHVLLQLAMPEVDFKKAETHLFVLQCLYQAGPRSEHVIRQSHADCQDVHFVHRLLDQLSRNLEMVRENWDSLQALNLFVHIITRIFSLAEAGRERCLGLLETARSIALSWIHRLRDRAHETRDHSNRTAFAAKKASIAMICGCTFDLDDVQLRKVLQSPEAASALIQCSILEQQGGSDKADDDDDDVIGRLLTLRFKRVLHHAHEVLLRNHDGLHDAIERIWTAYCRSAEGWQAEDDTSEWIFTSTVPKGANAAVSVHYNAISGDLLVDGCPLDRAPRAYREHPLFATLFGNSAVEVMPTMIIPGFSYCTLQQFSGCTVYLGMSSGDSTVDTPLRIRAVDGASSYEVLPAKLFEKTFPTHFVDDHVHWYNMNSGIISFRPLDGAWTFGPTDSLMMHPCESVRGRKLTENGYAVLGLDHPLSEHVSVILAPLALDVEIHVRVKSLRSYIGIPKLRLTFLGEEDGCRLISKDFPSMEVAQEQTIGTLVGLQSKLVLQRKTDGRRKLLIPEGPISYHKGQSHTVVRITREDMHTVHAFDIDEDLGRLVDSGSMSAKLLLAYIHALTASCLPDPFTGHTGTEQALTILSSAAVRSCHLLTADEVRMLDRISRLTPGRAYYPRNMRVMQSVSWDPDLSFLSQHSRFLTAAQDIYNQARNAAVFRIAALPSAPNFSFADHHLTARDEIRSSTFRISGYGAEDHTTDEDRQYKARDRSDGSKRAECAAFLSRMLDRGCASRFGPADVRDRVWSFFKHASRINGVESPISPLDLTYRTEYLQDWKDFVRENWLVIHRWMRQEDRTRVHRFALMAWICTMAFSDKRDMCILQALAMCTEIPLMSELDLHQVQVFFPRRGMDCQGSELRKILDKSLSPFHASPEFRLERNRNEPEKVFRNRRHSRFQQRRNAVVAATVGDLVSQWRRKEPLPPDLPATLDASSYLDLGTAMTEIRQSFASWYNNGVLFQYLESLDTDVSTRPQESFRFASVGVAEVSVPPSVRGFVDLRDMFSREAPDTSAIPRSPERLSAHQRPFKQASELQVNFRLESLIESLEADRTNSEYENSYLGDLRQSVAAMKKRAADGGNARNVCLPGDALECILEQSREHAIAISRAVTLALTSNIGTAAPLAIGHFPRVSCTVLLRQLSREGWRELAKSWRSWIVAFAIALTGLQRARRLIEVIAAHGDPTRDLENDGHTNWDPNCHPEYLLLEVESGLMIREVQREIAACMTMPPQNRNATMQMHMGEGKTSMIMPMCATDLADGTRLLRMIVAKAQCKQMAQMLTAKLGGLVDRRVFHMPISRDLRFDVSAARSVASMLHECRSQGGVLLVQPEHILSLQLMVCEAHMSGNTELFGVLMSILTLFDEYARDLVDESDENFDVRLELIYTMGTQRPIEHSPGRWILLQRVLEIVEDVAPALASAAPQAISVRRHVTSAFPRIRILRAEAGRLLVEAVIEQICARNIGGLPIGTQSPALRRAIREYISCAEPADVVVHTVERSNFWTESTKPLVLLLRGLLGHGLLTFVLAQKRWRVNYGLATRIPPTRLAVPYRALDCPTPRSEFSHPDVVITLTLLSYYYEGLRDDDLFAAFDHLKSSDAAEVEYQAWVGDANDLASGLRQLQSVNLEDRGHCISRLFPALRYAKSVIDYFLAHHVFPKEMREFPCKISASGWDIGKTKGQALTGFSGTCDSRHLLPLDVHHIDLEAQQHTNALVLEHLLRPDNGIHQMLAPTEFDGTSDAEHVISIAGTMRPPVQVVLDVGAQVLEMSNITFATTWLSVCTDDTKEAAVFVNERDEVCVVDRAGRVDSLYTSPFVERMQACLVFLDEAHTRGIDLILPQSYRALVTLGPHLTKDRLAQACMRMRKLGKGQTVVFCVPVEVRDEIVERMGHQRGRDMEIADILCWSMRETHIDIHNSMPLWAVQGNRFARQAEVWGDAVGQPNNLRSTRLLEDEAQTIERRYQPRPLIQDMSDLSGPAGNMTQRIAAHCRRFDGLQLSASILQEEQERELSPEAEQERQVQRPPLASPATHDLHHDVTIFATEGIISSQSRAYMPAFMAFQNTSMGRNFDLAQFEGDRDLLVTTDFANTIQSTNADDDTDVFQRPVRWLLTKLDAEGSKMDCIMIVSPFEANSLYVRMKDAKRTTLHLYKPWCNLAYESIDRLTLHTVPHRAAPPSIPTLLAIRLCLFGGQLYLSSHPDYLAICRYLGLWMGDLTDDMEAAGWEIAADCFIQRDGEGRAGGRSDMQQSPVSFVRELMSIRRSGQSISRTHMGRLLEGQALFPQDFDAVTQ